MSINAMKSCDLYLVASRLDLNDEEFLAIVKLALEGGVDCVQLREKQASTREFYALAKKLQSIIKPFGVPFLINDRLDIALALDADGIHLGQDDLPLSRARLILGEQKIIGLSITQANELSQVHGASYLGIGAIFPTQSKIDAKLTGVNLLYEASQTKLPLIAIGGINANNLANLESAPFDGVAVVSAIMHSPNPKQSALELKKMIQSIKKKRTTHAFIKTH